MALRVAGLRQMITERAPPCFGVSFGTRLTRVARAAHTAGVDPELVAYLDRRFDEFRQEHVSRREFDEFRTEVRAEFADVRLEMRSGFADVRADLRREIAESAAETRRHFDVVAKSLRSTIQLIAEGVLTVDRKLDRFADEVRDEFRKVDRRFLKIEARLGMTPGGPDS